jgi:flagellar hook-associated protein 2
MMATQSISSTGTITFSGLATGIDTGSIVSQLMALERAPAKILTNHKTKMQSQVDAYSQISTALTSLQSLMAGMKTASTFTAKNASVGDSSVAGATASGAAMAGIHYLKVTSLARSQTLVSESSTMGGYTSNTAQDFGTGTFTITDSTGGQSPVSITIDSTNNSLQGIANAINASGANVTASVINDGSGTPYRLAINGKDTNTYSVNASLTGGTYDTPTFDQKVAASTAVFQLDGIAMTRTSNTVVDAIPGVTLALLAPNDPSETIINIGNDTSAITKKINDFVTGYNSVMSLVNQYTSYDQNTKTAGILLGDATIRTVLDSIQTVLTNQVAEATGSFSSLSEIGIGSDKKTGALSIDSSRLAEALGSNFNDVVSLFTQNGETAGLDRSQYGIAEQFNQQIDLLTHYYSGASNSGIISTRIHGLNDSMTNIDSQIAAMEVRLIAQENRLNAQFTAMEQLISSTNAWGNQLLAALGVTNTSSSK